MGDIMKTVIIEDDIEFANKLKKILDQFKIISFDVEINNFDDKFDLYFLDIDMPQLDGISYAKCIRSKFPDVRIVFVSYRTDLVFDAIQVFPFSFVRKEHLEEELNNVLKKIQEIEAESVKVLHINDDFSVPFDKIIYLEKRGSYAYVITENNVYKIRKSLNYLYDLLNRYFIYINKGTIVNLKCVKKLKKDEITLTNDAVFYISRGRRNEFILSYLKYKEEV